MNLYVSSLNKTLDFPNDSMIHCYLNYDNPLESVSGYFLNIL